MSRTIYFLASVNFFFILFYQKDVEVLRLLISKLSCTRSFFFYKHCCYIYIGPIAFMFFNMVFLYCLTVVFKCVYMTVNIV